jgi:acyl-coenzyme A thioesterase PaaI-like protein
MDKKEAPFAGRQGLRYPRVVPTRVNQRAVATAELTRPLDDLITGYFFAAAEVLAQLEKE